MVEKRNQGESERNTAMNEREIEREKERKKEWEIEREEMNKKD